MVTILDLTNFEDIEKLRVFSLLDHPSTFRYFKNRVFEQAIQTHIITLMYSTYGYAHIDKDVSSGRCYLGICVMPEKQGIGIGKKLINTLLKLYNGDLYLTVDKENISAISLYEKVGFYRIDENDKNYTYRKLKDIRLEVSVGESIDKLTILDIKLEKINDTSKKIHCKREADSIRLDLKHYIESTNRFYVWLKYINTQIWDLQDDMRESNNYSKEAFHKILDLNDMRFRVKQRINSMFKTSFQEQKGYSTKTGLFVTHLGLGDLINMNGAIRYAALMVDKLYVVCKQRNIKNIKEMFLDDASIEILPCNDDDSDVNDILNNKRRTKNRHTPVLDTFTPYFNEIITHKFVSGGFCGRRIFNDIPNNFYDDLKFSKDIKHVFSYFNTTSMLPLPGREYIFTHSSSSSNNDLHFEKKWDINEILTLDPCKNYYSSDHKWFSLGQMYLNKPLLSYIDLIKNAREVHVTDSSFYCLTCFITPIASKKVCYDRSSGHISTQYMFD